jgi:hypothetical protein
MTLCIFHKIGQSSWTFLTGKVLTYLHREVINLADDFNLNLSNLTFGGQRQREHKNAPFRVSPYLSYVKFDELPLNYPGNPKLMIFP